MTNDPKFRSWLYTHVVVPYMTQYPKATKTRLHQKLVTATGGFSRADSDYLFAQYHQHIVKSAGMS